MTAIIIVFTDRNKNTSRKYGIKKDIPKTKVSIIIMLFNDNQIGLNSVIKIYRKITSRIKIKNIRIIDQIKPNISKDDKIVFWAFGEKVS